MGKRKRIRDAYWRFVVLLLMFSAAAFAGVFANFENKLGVQDALPTAGGIIAATTAVPALLPTVKPASVTPGMFLPPVTSAAPSPSPSPSPTTSPSPSPTPSPSPDPSPMPTPTPSSSPSPTPEPTSAYAEAKYIALTFDDGPTHETTDRLLDILRDNGVKVTFFVQAYHLKAPKNAKTLARMAEDGHEIGSHTWNHPYLTKLSAESLAEQLDDTNAAIAAITGAVPTLLRPPYGDYNDTVRAAAAERGMSLILWNVDPRDWQTKNADAIIKHVKKHTRDRAIILMHDIHSATVDAADTIVKNLLEDGYTLVTVSELLKLKYELVPGAVYNSGE